MNRVTDMEWHKEASFIYKYRVSTTQNARLMPHFLKNNPVHLNLFENFRVFMSNASQKKLRHE